jgi:hypothetical protein
MALARIRTVFTGVAGTPWYSNLYFLNDGGTSIAATATTWVTAFWNSLDNQMGAGISWATDPEVPTFNQATGKITKTDAVTPGTGTSSGVGEVLPYATQLLIRLVTDEFVNGRRVRGRIFVPAPLEADNVSGLPGASIRTPAQTAINTLITSSTSTLAIWSRPFAGDPENPNNPARIGTQHVVDLGQVWTQWAVLRSRRN